MSAEARLAELGITLPEPPKAVASYVPFVVHDGIVFVSGQVPISEGGVPRLGVVGADLTEEEAVEEARVCGLNVLAQLREAAGSLDRIARILKLTIYVASAPGFHAQPTVANGASDLMADVFGEAGRHARAAVGCNELPLGVPVEVEAIAALVD